MQKDTSCPGVTYVLESKQQPRTDCVAIFAASARYECPHNINWLLVVIHYVNKFLSQASVIYPHVALLPRFVRIKFPVSTVSMLAGDHETPKQGHSMRFRSRVQEPWQCGSSSLKAKIEALKNRLPKQQIISVEPPCAQTAWIPLRPAFCIPLQKVRASASETKTHENVPTGNTPQLRSPFSHAPKA